MKSLILLVCLFSIPNHTLFETMHCDRIEVNHVVSEGYTQVIYWEWTKEGFRVLGWRTLKEGGPSWKNQTATDLVSYGDGKQILIQSRSFLETRTNYDREIMDRKHRPLENRPEKWHFW